MQPDAGAFTPPTPQNYHSARREARNLLRDIKLDAVAFLKRADRVAVKRIDDAVHKRGIGRDRAWQQIQSEIGRAPLMATDNFVLWRWLQVGPPSIMPCDDCIPTLPSARDVLEVNSLSIGSLSGRHRLLADYWSLSITDHVLHRFFERGGTDVVAAVLEAHTAVCCLSLGLIEHLVREASWAFPAGPGALLVQPVALIDCSSLHMLGRTWVHRDMLRPEQEAQVRAVSARVPDFVYGPMRPRILTNCRRTA